MTEHLSQTPLREHRGVTIREVVWFGFTVGSLLLLTIDDLATWTWFVLVAALLLALLPRMTPASTRRVDGKDLLAVAVLYTTVVASFWVAFNVFTTENVLGLFLTFGGGLVLGVAGPIIYQVWIRGRDLRSVGIGGHRLKETVVIGVVLAGIQFATTLWDYQLPSPIDWVPLLVMSLVVGLFEAVFFRGFIQGRIEASFGVVPSVAGAAILYAVYHVGYGMGGAEMWFLFGLGVVYAIAYRLTENILVLWPVLTPLGAFFNNLQAGDIALPWASIAGFADVAAVMALAIWLGQRRVRSAATTAPTSVPRRMPTPR